MAACGGEERLGGLAEAGLVGEQERLDGPPRAFATTWAWCGIRSRPGAMMRVAGGGSVMHDRASTVDCSNARSSGLISSQSTSSRGRGRGAGAAEKSGARNGLARLRATADCGTT